MSFFERLGQVVRGWFGLKVGELENSNPEAVYEAAIDERVKKHRELKKAVSGIVYLRNKLQAELEQKTKELAEIELQIPIAVEDGEDEVAVVLIEKKDELTASITSISAELEKISAQAEDAKQGLVQFQAEIEKLKREKIEMLAKKANAEARIKIQETLDGLSTDADIKALDNVRETIHKKAAEADVAGEVRGESLDAKLAKIKTKTANASARAQLAEMKKASASRQADAGKKTI
jgi:phage shock protein A